MFFYFFLISCLFFCQISSAEIVNPRLTASVAAKLTICLLNLHLLKEVTITNPTDATKLPHVTSVRRLKISGLPSYCNDWQWLNEIQDLQELELETGETNEETGKKLPFKKPNSLVVSGEKTDISISEISTSDLLCNVLKCLPLKISNEVS